MTGAAIDATEGEERVGTGGGPAHAGALHPLLDDVVHRTLDGAAADEQPLTAEGAVAHAFSMRREVAVEAVEGFDLRLRARSLSRESQRFEHLVDLVVFEAIELGRAPLRTILRSLAVELAGDERDVFVAVKPVEDFDALGERPREEIRTRPTSRVPGTAESRLQREG